MKVNPPKKVLAEYQQSGAKFALVLWLDQRDAFTDIKAKTKREFDAKFAEWKKVELPILRKSVYTIYIISENNISVY